MKRFFFVPVFVLLFAGSNAFAFKTYTASASENTVVNQGAMLYITQTTNNTTEELNSFALHGPTAVRTVNSVDVTYVPLTDNGKAALAYETGANRDSSVKTNEWSEAVKKRWASNLKNTCHYTVANDLIRNVAVQNGIQARFGESALKLYNLQRKIVESSKKRLWNKIVDRNYPSDGYLQWDDDFLPVMTLNITKPESIRSGKVSKKKGRYLESANCDAYPTINTEADYNKAYTYCMEEQVNTKGSVSCMPVFKCTGYPLPGKKNPAPTVTKKTVRLDPCVTKPSTFDTGSAVVADNSDIVTCIKKLKDEYNSKTGTLSNVTILIDACSTTYGTGNLELTQNRLKNTKAIVTTELGSIPATIITSTPRENMYTTDGTTFLPTGTCGPLNTDATKQDSWAKGTSYTASKKVADDEAQGTDSGRFDWITGLDGKGKGITGTDDQHAAYRFNKITISYDKEEKVVTQNTQAAVTTEKVEVTGFNCLKVVNN